MKILLLDIDHTISDAAWRDDMINDRDWDAYHSAGKDDKPIQETVELVNGLFVQGWEIICLTARPEKWYQHTIEWMVRHNVSVNEVLMRGNNDYTSAPDSKIAIIKKRFGEALEGLLGHHVMLIDDNEKVIEAMRGLNITTMQITAAKRRT